MTQPITTLVLDTFPVYQKGFTFYIAVLPAAKLVQVCRGLAPTDDEEGELLSQAPASPEDGKKLVEALNAPAFAKEVTSAQEKPYDEEQPYQRIYDEARVRSIASYLREEDAILPNSIILAARDDVEVTVSSQGNVAQVKLDWEPDAIPLNIIDGQHRVEGLRLLLEDPALGFADFGVAVTLLIDLPFWSQAQLFAVVNGRQKQVPRSRVYDLLGYMPMGDKETRNKAYQGEMALHRFCHHVVKVLNQSEKSPWRGKVKMRGSGTGVVTQAALVDHLAIYLKPKKERPDTRTLPILYPFYRESDIIGLAKVLIVYFVGVQRAHPRFWETTETLKPSLFGKTNGVAVMFNVLHNLAVMAGGVTSMRLERTTELWRKVDDKTIAEPPKGGSKGYQALVTDSVMKQMLGDGYPAQLAAAAEPVKANLRSLQALL